jgi:nucleotide-binding universal stress UspA family protein
MYPRVLRPVVAAMELSDQYPVAVDVAAAEADARGLPLRLVLIRRRPTMIASARAAPGTAVLSAGEARQRVLEAYPDLAVTTTETDDPASALREEARRATLVVLGRQPRPVSGTSLPVEVAARAGCPVIVTPTGERVRARSHRPIVIAVKARDRDAAAITFGLQQAAWHRAPVRVIHVWLNIPDMEYANVDPYVYDLADAGRDADRLIEAAIDGRDEEYPQVLVQRVPLYRVDVAETLIDASADAGLLVLGPPSRDRAGTAALSPMSQALIDNADCPVAVACHGHHPAVTRTPATRRVYSALELLDV